MGGLIRGETQSSHMAVQQRPAFGMRHLTVVPTNLDRTGEDDEEPTGTDA